MSGSWEHSIAGAGAGLVALSATYPLLVLTTRSQVAAKPIIADERVEKNITTDTSSLSSLYSGFFPAVVGAVISQGIYYYLYEYSKSIVGPFVRETTRDLLSGALAGSGTVVLTNPLWVVYTQISTTSDSIAWGTLKATTTIYDREGLAGFWKGLWPALILVANPTIQYGLYEAGLRWIRARSPDKEGRGVHFLWLGAISKLIATVGTYPLQMVRSRLHLSFASAKESTSSQDYDGMLDAFKKIWSVEGPSTFFRGLESKLLQTVLHAAVLMWTKEKLYRILRLFKLLRQLRM